MPKSNKVDAIIGSANPGVGLFYNDLSEYKLLTRKEERELVAAMQDGDMDARHKLVLHNIGLVCKSAASHLGRGRSYLDLIQDGVLGLIHAIDKFDLSKGTRISTYATRWISNYQKKSIATHSTYLAVPHGVSELIPKCYAISRRLESEMGQVPTIPELAAEMCVSEELVVDILSVMRIPVSINSMMSRDSDDSVELGEFIEDTTVKGVHESMTETVLQETLDTLLAVMNPRNARVIRMRYGLNGYATHTYTEIGAKLGITRERARQIEAQALTQLRMPANAAVLRDFLDGGDKK